MRGGGGEGLKENVKIKGQDWQVDPSNTHLGYVQHWYSWSRLVYYYRNWILLDDTKNLKTNY